MSKKISDLTAATTPLSGSELVEIVQSGVSKKVAASYFGGAAASRERLTADRNYYVRSDGSDANNGLANTSGGAFLTIQKAVDVSSGDLDLGIYNVTINCADATRTEKVVLKTYVGANAPAIVGNTSTPANCLMSATSGHCFANSSGRAWSINGFKLTTTTSGNGINCIGGGSTVDYSNIDFGACASSQIYASKQSVVTALTNYSITGSTTSHCEVVEGGIFVSGGKTVTLTGTPAWSVGYLYGRKGHAVVNSMTFSGSATGNRINLNLCSTVFSNGGAEATYFPGNAAGSKSTGSEWA